MLNKLKRSMHRTCVLAGSSDGHWTTSSGKPCSQQFQPALIPLMTAFLADENGASGSDSEACTDLSDSDGEACPASPALAALRVSKNKELSHRISSQAWLSSNDSLPIHWGNQEIYMEIAAEKQHMHDHLRWLHNERKRDGENTQHVTQTQLTSSPYLLCPPSDAFQPEDFFTAALQEYDQTKFRPKILPTSALIQPPWYRTRFSQMTSTDIKAAVKRISVSATVGVQSRSLTLCWQMDESLTHIDMTGSSLSDSSAQPLCNLLATSLFRFHSLNLSSNRLGLQSMKELSRWNGRGAAIQRLCLHNNPIGDNGIKYLSMVIAQCRLLNELDLSRCRIESKGAEFLGNALRETDKLQRLNLMWNGMRSPGIDVVISTCTSLPDLSVLNISWNNCTGSASGHIGVMIEETQSLKVLDISFCGIQNRDCMVVGEALFRNESLDTVIFDGNPIGKVGGQILFQFMDFKGYSNFELKFDQCNLNFESEGLFDPSRPEGFHRLDLSNPFERAIAQYLYRKSCNNGPDVENWKGEKIDGRSLDVPEDGSWFVPREGVLEVLGIVHFLRDSSLTGSIAGHVFTNREGQASGCGGGHPGH